MGKKTIIKFILLYIAVIPINLHVFASTPSPTPIANTNNINIIMPHAIAAPALHAKSYLLQDYNSGATLVAHNANDRIEPASLTKIMTMYVVDKELKESRIAIDDKVIISKQAWQMSGSRMFVAVNSTVPVSDLIRGIIVQSGNDASVALAEHIAGSEEAFANLMNQEAKRLGMNNTNFVNATGLPDPGHYTTTHDLAILARAIIHDFPESYKLYGEKWFIYNGIKQPNRNRLLWRTLNVDGIKTGHTDSAGFCLVSSATDNDTRLIAVVVGATSDDDRINQSEALLKYGFRFFETRKLYDNSQALQTARVWFGTEHSVPIGAMQDVYVTVPRGQYKNLHATISLHQDIEAPVAIGNKIGNLTITLGADTVNNIDLFTLQSVPGGNIWQRMKDRVRIMLRKFTAHEDVDIKATMQQAAS